MPKQLTQAALDAMLKDRALYRAVEDLTPLNPGMLYFKIRRKSKALNDFTIVETIANYLQVPPGTLQEEATPKQRKPRNRSKQPLQAQ